MAQDKDQKTLNVPPLRFPGFTDEWKNNKVGNLFEISVAGDIDKSSISHNQSKKYPYPIISNSLENEGIYGYTNKYKCEAGTITVTGRGTLGIAKSRDYKYYPIVRLLSLKPCDSIDYRFAQYALNLIHYFFEVTGVPQLTAPQLSSYDIRYPTLSEQQKIARFLSLIDERIATQNKIIDNLQSLIKGLIQHLIRVGLEKGTWHKVMLSEVLQERNEVNIEYYPVHSVSVSVGIVNQIEYLGRSFAAKDTSHYHVVRYGDIVYTKSPTGNQPYGIIKQSFCQNPVAVSPLYGVYDPISFEIGNILHYYFLNPLNTNNYLLPLIQKGAKNTINITNRRFLENIIPLPISNEEIISVSKTLSSLNSKIELENRALNTLLKERQYLLNMLFI